MGVPIIKVIVSWGLYWGILGNYYLEFGAQAGMGLWERGINNCQPKSKAKVDEGLEFRGRKDARSFSHLKTALNP